MEEEKSIFDKERFDLGVKLVCDAFDEAGMTLSERFRASYIIAVTSATMLGQGLSELADKFNLLTVDNAENNGQDGSDEPSDEVGDGE